MPLPNQALVLVLDGRKMLFFRNHGDENQIDLRTEAHDEREDRKDSDMKIVAYKGWPLYLWIKDTKPGDTTGDGVGGTWHTAVEGGAM